jgi:NAD(P)-dependent dehydrogenase (short-subunit alcohol dehydrogenase family)
MSARLEGRVALVTGAAHGIGRAYAERLARDGADVVIADIADAAETVALVRAAGRRALAVPCDVSEPGAVTALADAATREVEHVDILVHNAGIYPITPFAEITFEEWRRVLAVNLDSFFLLCAAFLPGMRERGWGRVVAMSSTAVHAGVPGFVHYVASKAGLVGAVRGLAGEVGDEGVTVNALAPSLVRTKGTTEGPHDELGQFDLVRDMQAIRRTQQPTDLVGALAFLVSDEAAFITGQTLAVDGGFVRA